MATNHIEVFTKYVENLLGLLEKIEAHEKNDPSILRKRLIGDMLPLFSQVEIAASFALRACCPIVGEEVVSFASEEKSFSGLKNQLNQTIDYLQKLDKTKIDSEVTVSDMAGPVPVSLPASEFVLKFALPNFFFHISMVYAIARIAGLPVTKGDYDGIHQYALGFSYE